MRLTVRTMRWLAFALALTIEFVPSVGRAGPDPLRIAYIDDLSGPLAVIGERGLKHIEFMAERMNRGGGVAGHPVEIVPFDNENNAEKTLILLKRAIDSGIGVVSQGASSSIGYAVSDMVTKQYRRQPDRPVVYLDWSNADPGLTNDKCSFWHFRFTLNSDQQTKAMVSYLALKSEVRKVYLLNQDYSMGQSVEANLSEGLPKVRPDIQIVGTERVPLGRVKDFAPYVAKIQASGADTVITANFGPDLSLFAKAASAGGLKATLYTFYGNTPGMASALRAEGKGMVNVAEWNSHVKAPELEAIAADYKAKTKADFAYWRMALQMIMLQKAVEKANSIQPLAIATALDGLVYQSPIGPIIMRKSDHQVVQPVYVSVFTDETRVDLEGTGFGFKMIGAIDASEVDVPTSCRMTGPKS
ncbi:branched-chain amino acid ABC transporter substrate-binding protein [Bradyrhizobium liaoningense]|uniref:branched-chain amino acid ABC transporter substrate-binding protein n=1 Tax=Bradyrhizobium liaoningense TaxID=43992 RepID=UPI001BA6A5E4|nr:branched-chain amino acid ABC transporter substrate-binding protein [Bradyrhizobium liaoningense]MBR0987991.1 branched-chain amino acid ABC transporter substrate-binding protein [Bradyrhizobium liaoningense]